jgi:cysteine desulfurase/selenocysteine lyase
MTIENIRREFPQLQLQVNGQPLVYLDSAASALKPRSVIEKMRQYMEMGAANVHRGAHHLSDVATDEYESVRDLVAQFIGAKSASEIVFTSGTTAGLNLIAHSLARSILKEGDEVLLSQMEHHSNVVPWQMAAKEKHAIVRFIPVNEDGSLDRAAYRSMLNPKTKIVAITQLSNALGTWNELKDLVAEARKQGAYFVVDAAQSITARPVNVQEIDCDFLVFSGHKLFGPTGIGVLYGKEEVLKDMPPFFGGGSMIEQVTEKNVTFLSPPHRFEAGTPPIGEVLALGEAIRFYKNLDAQSLIKHDRELLKFTQAELSKLDISVLAPNVDRSHVLSFNVAGAHPSDVGAMLNEQGIAVRAGHHCCQPLMARFKIPGTVRASFSIYSSEEDVAKLVTALKKVKGFFA